MALENLKVEIIGWDLDNIEGSSGCYLTPIKIKPRANETWNSLFIESYQAVCGRTRRTVDVAGDKLIIHMRGRDNKRDHARIIKQAVDLANNRYEQMRRD